MPVPIRARFTLELSCPTTGGKYLTHLSVIATREVPFQKQIQTMQDISGQANQTQNSSEFLSKLKEVCEKYKLVLVES